MNKLLFSLIISVLFIPITNFCMEASIYRIPNNSEKYVIIGQRDDKCVMLETSKGFYPPQFSKNCIFKNKRPLHINTQEGVIILNKYRHSLLFKNERYEREQTIKRSSASGSEKYTTTIISYK